MTLLLSDIVEVSSRVAATRRRTEKIAALVDLFSRAGEADVPIMVAMLSGAARQGKIGVGYRAVSSIRAEPAGTPTVTIVEVDQILTALKDRRGEGSQADRESLLTDLFGRCTAPEQDFLKRLLVGGVRQGALEGIMTDAVAAAAGVPAAAVRRALMMLPDLGRVATVALAGGAGDLAGIGLEVLRPIQPMLAKTAASATAAVQAEGLSSVEWKLDGVRIQVHRAGSVVRIYTRNLNDVTERLPDVADVVLGFGSEHFVLDGEVISLTAGNEPRAFVETMSRFGTEHRDGEEAPVVPFFFDVLHEGGQDLIDLPLSARQEVLDQVVPAAYRVTRVITDQEDRAERTLVEARAEGHEGIMVKRLDSSYEAGRRGATWLKVKPANTLDLVVLAVEWGSGRRQGWLSNIHLGAREAATGDFIMLGKTFKGMTDEMLEWQTGRFLELETHRDGHVVHVRPEQVVEIAFDGIQASSRYPGGMALRFARVKSYRHDKAAREADTVDTVRAIFEK
ncbi:MAG: ATP-dependent DNA ligase [Acidimicrobiia bacterium]|nr:ATP-dependent DNA ligase [Acidimicrobiia bacterium]